MVNIQFIPPQIKIYKPMICFNKSRFNTDEEMGCSKHVHYHFSYSISQFHSTELASFKEDKYLHCPQLTTYFENQPAKLWIKISISTNYHSFNKYIFV